MLEWLVPLERFINPSAYPAANEYPSLSRHLSETGFLPIKAKVTSVMSLFEVPLWMSPMHTKAAVYTFRGISISYVGGNKKGIWRQIVFEVDSSDFPILEADNPKRIPTHVASWLCYKY